MEFYHSNFYGAKIQNNERELMSQELVKLRDRVGIDARDPVHMLYTYEEGPNTLK